MHYCKFTLWTVFFVVSHTKQTKQSFMSLNVTEINFSMWVRFVEKSNVKLVEFINMSIKLFFTFHSSEFNPSSSVIFVYTMLRDNIDILHAYHHILQLVSWKIKAFQLKVTYLRSNYLYLFCTHKHLTGEVECYKNKTKAKYLLLH